ncbi:MAG: magnesium-translocating P-type ATPase, partial [Bacteroidota bacterium]|nr:magnesium-translocating P-type ATPase [Bacteroidota bacterium]
MMPASIQDIATMEVDALPTLLNTHIEAGLTKDEAEDRLLRYGPNTIVSKTKDSFLRELLKHFRSPLVLLLLGATIISYVVGETVSASIIFVIVLTSVLIDFFQERDARNAAEKLKELVKARVSVIRDGAELEIFP